MKLVTLEHAALASCLTNGFSQLPHRHRIVDTMVIAGNGVEVR